MEREIADFGEELMRELQLINQYKVESFIGSNVVKTPLDEIKLINFFEDKSFKSARLLYRAS